MIDRSSAIAAKVPNVREADRPVVAVADSTCVTWVAAGPQLDWEQRLRIGLLTEALDRTEVAAADRPRSAPRPHLDSSGAGAWSQSFCLQVRQSRLVHLMISPLRPMLGQLVAPTVIASFYRRKLVTDLTHPLAELALENLGPLTRNLLSWADRVLVSSQNLAVRLRRLGIAAAASPLCLEPRLPSERRLESVQPRVVSYVWPERNSGGLTTGLTLLLKTHDLVKQKYPRAQMCLLCDSTSGVGAMLKSRDLPPGMNFREIADVGQLHEAFRQADVYVNTLPIGNPAGVMLNAMACSLPMVSTPGTQASEYLQNAHNALLAGSGGASELAAALCRLVESPRLAASLAAEGRKTAAVIGQQVTALRWRELYSGLI